MVDRFRRLIRRLTLGTSASGGSSPAPGDRATGRGAPARSPRSSVGSHLPGHAMVAEQLRARGIRDPRILAVMERLDRRAFVPAGCREGAFGDAPLHIGHGQTISQPYMVAVMTELLELQPHHHVLEIGTGSGYQAAVLAPLCASVVTLERWPDLAARARALLAELGLSNVTCLVRDGSRGCPEHAPYDRIVVTAAAPRISKELLDQLGDGGILVAPEGTAAAADAPRHRQRLRRWIRRGDKFDVEDLFDVRFVPLVEDDPS